MHGTLPVRITGATNAADTSVGRPTNLSEEALDDWFVAAAPTLLAPKPGFILDLETGCGERNGDRYANGSVKVPSGVVRRLFHGTGGRAWLNAFMCGCKAQWWLDLQRAERIAEQFDKINRD